MAEKSTAYQLLDADARNIETIFDLKKKKKNYIDFKLAKIRVCRTIWNLCFTRPLTFVQTLKQADVNAGILLKHKYTREDKNRSLDYHSCKSTSKSEGGQFSV